MKYVLPAPPVTSLPVAGIDQQFAVRRIYCIGRNYEEHAREMGFVADREAPFFFLKPADAVVQDGDDVPYPVASQNVHHEIELVVAIGSGGRDIPVDRALEHVYGYAVGNDLTRRDLQIAAREKGRPWEAGKAVDHSAPISALVPAAQIGHPAQARIWLHVNGAVRQDADISDLIWSVPELISYLSGLYELHPGDLIMTGTPAGVGPVQVGDVLEGGIDGVGTLTTKVI